jgi:hypothetical protein
MLKESEAQTIEDNLLGYRDSASLTRFREIFPIQTPRKPPTKASDYRNPFVGAVLELNARGIDWREAQWAVGRATSRLEPGAPWEEVLGLAGEILKAREAA